MTIFQLLQRRFASWPDAVSRRELLQAAIATAGGLLTRDRTSAAPVKSSLPRVAVIGAGFAGLACADELAAAGYSVTVFEARDRVGGRVQTLRDVAANKTVEAGGELVGPNQPTWMAYAKRFDLRFLENSSEPTDVVWLDGLLPPGEARELWQEMRTSLQRLNSLAEPIDAYQPWKSPRARPLDARSLDDWIRELDSSPRCQRLIDIQMTGINGVISAWQSLLGILAIVRGGGLQKFWDETDTLHCVGGTQQLAERLAQSFTAARGSDALRLRTPVHALRRRNDRVQVELAGGRQLEFDDVVLTVPASTWCKIAFDPPLPPEWNVPMAASTKYVAVFPTALWRELKRSPSALADGPVQLTWEMTYGQGEAGPHVLVAFAGGRSADECRSWPPNEREKRFREQLDRLYPGAAKAMSHGRFVDWISDPWARGTYSFPAPGQVTALGPQLDRGHHRIHLAGEHVCYAFVGWMEGALSSGVRLARRLAERDA